MIVLEHLTSTGARVLRIRPESKSNELFDFALPGDTMYQVPVEHCESAEKLMKYLQNREGVPV